MINKVKPIIVPSYKIMVEGISRNKIDRFKKDIENKLFPYLLSEYKIDMKRQSFSSITTVTYDGYLPNKEIISIEFQSNNKDIEGEDIKSLFG